MGWFSMQWLEKTIIPTILYGPSNNFHSTGLWYIINIAIFPHQSIQSKKWRLQLIRVKQNSATKDQISLTKNSSWISESISSKWLAQNAQSPLTSLSFPKVFSGRDFSSNEFPCKQHVLEIRYNFQIWF